MESNRQGSYEQQSPTLQEVQVCVTKCSGSEPCSGPAQYCSLLTVAIQRKWTFECNRKTKGASKPRVITIDLDNRTIVQSRKKGPKAKALDVYQIQRVDKKRLRLLSTVSVNGELVQVCPNIQKDNVTEYQFKSALMRERCYEACIFCLGGGAAKFDSEFMDISIFVGTWNMGDARPPGRFAV